VDHLDKLRSTITSTAANICGFQPALTEAAGIVRNMAQTYGATPAQIAIAWLLHQGEDIVPIPGTKRQSRLLENVAAASITLNAEDLNRLTAALAPSQIGGERYDENYMALVDF
jgi:aryl-alcohol dehydrogenase-like predicted oxidoreductase